MSEVTNLILSIGTLDWDDRNIERINAYFEDGRRGFVSVDSPELPSGWYGGTKMLEARLYIGAFNYFDLEGFKNFLRSIHWEYPEEIQLIVKEHHDDVFRIETLTEEQENE